MSSMKKVDTHAVIAAIVEDDVAAKAAAGGREGNDNGAAERTKSGGPSIERTKSGGPKIANARKKFQHAVSSVKSMMTVMNSIKGPTVVGRTVGGSIGRKNHQTGKGQGSISSTEVLRALMSKLAISWKSVGAIFNHFDRPDMEDDGKVKGDSEISLQEFILGIRNLKLDFSDEQIEEVFKIVDVDGSGSIDHSELEAALRECGVLKSISVQRVPKTVKQFDHERAEKKIEDEAKEEQKAKKGKTKKGQPIDIPGMSNQVAEGLHSLDARVEALRGIMHEVRGTSNQFNLILEQYSKATGDAQENTRMQLLEASEGLVKRMADGIAHYKKLADEIHAFTVELIHDLPRDYRVVWKAAVISEIDEKGGLVRVFNEEMAECERDYLQMKEQCREWRVVDVKNPTLDFTVKKDADGPVGASEGYAQTMQHSREWVKTAVGYGFANQKDMLRKLESVKEHMDEDEILEGKSLMGLTQALGAKLAPYVEESNARIALRLEELDARARKAPSSPQNGKTGAGTPSCKSANRSSAQASVRSEGNGAPFFEQMSGVSANAAHAQSVATFQSHANTQRRNKMSLVSGTDLNYEGIYQQLNLVQEIRSQFESGLEAADLSSIADTDDTSMDSHVRQLVRTRITQLSRNVKESVVHSPHGHHAQLAALPTPSAAATKQPSEVHEDGSPSSQRPRLRARERKKLAQAEEEEARMQTASDAGARTEGRKGAPSKSVWKKLDEQIARHAESLASERARKAALGTGLVKGEKGDVAALHVALPRGTVRRTTKPPPDRIVSSTAVFKGLNSVSRPDGQARTHRSSHLASDTRIGRARAHVIPTASCALLARPSQKMVENGGDAMDTSLGSSLLPGNPAAQAWSDLQKAAREKMIFCGVTLEVHLPEAGFWTAVAEANFMRELSALLGVPTSDLGLDGRVSDLVPTRLQIEMRHSKHWAGDIVDQVSLQAQDPTSLLWALPHLAKITVQGMIFERSAMHGSPPREDVFLEASADGASPQLTSHAWEEVKAPMMRVESRGNDIISASEASADPDSMKDRPATSPSGDAALLLMQAGIDVDDDAVLELAEANILEEARRVFRKKREGDSVEAVPANEEGLLELPQPGKGTRPIVLRESTQPFTTGNTAELDEHAENLILRMLLALMETAEDQDAEVQAALDAETRLYLDAKEDEARRQAALAEARHFDDDTCQSVSSLLSQDGDGAMVATGESRTDGRVRASGDLEIGGNAHQAAGSLAHQPPPIAFDNERVERHHQLVENTLVRIADSMDALTNFTMHLASAAERAPAAPSYLHHQPTVGAVHVQSPAQHSNSAHSGGDSMVDETVMGAASTWPPSDGSPCSGIVESDFTPPKSTDSDEAWTPVQSHAANHQDVQTSIDFEVQTAMREMTSGPANRPQHQTHSAQTSIDFDAIFPNLRTRSRGRVEAINQQLQTSFDFDEPSSARRVASSTNTSAPPSPVKELKAHVVEPAGASSVPELTEPLTHTLISALQSVAEEVALLREARLAQPSPAAARSREAGLGAAEGGKHGHGGERRESSRAAAAMPLQQWLTLDAARIDAGEQVRLCATLFRSLCS